MQPTVRWLEVNRHVVFVAVVTACTGACSGGCGERAGGAPPASAGSSPAPPPRPSEDATPAAASPTPGAGRMTSVGPGFTDPGPWVSFYGNAQQMGDPSRVAATFRIINIDADPTADGVGNFTGAQLAVLHAGGKNKVLSYLDVGSCERFRSYWSAAPAGFVPCGANRSAQLGAYEGYPDEVWMNPADPSYRKLIVEFVAARLAARGVDGFYLDNLELLGHPADGANGPCDARCKQGGLDLVRALRERFPQLLLVLQNGTSDVTRLGKTGGVPFPTLLDGIAHEEVYEPDHDAEAEAELLAWKAMDIRSATGRPFWIAIEDYVGSCTKAPAAKTAFARARHHGFSPYVSDESAGQRVVCYWGL